MSSSLQIAIVIPWFGRDQKGGAEQQAWQIAQRLSTLGYGITVLTSCSESFLHRWDRNYYPAGTTFSSGIKVKRFKVEKRNTRKFNHVVGKLLALPPDTLDPNIPPLTIDEEKCYWSENIRSIDLVKYLRSHEDCYDGIICLPYLFSFVVDAIFAAPQKSFLQACLHNEAYAFLDRTKQAFSIAKGLFFNSSGEYSLASSLYGDWISVKSRVIGEGVEPMNHPLTMSLPIDLPSRYILCLGRKCAEKGTYKLLDEFHSFKKREPNSDLYLIFAGPESIAQFNREEIHVRDLGLVDQDTKYWLISKCLALINPSQNESFSRVIFEAWSLGRPVIVNGSCHATKTALKESGNAGWKIDSSESYHSTFLHISKCNEEELQRLGRKGLAYAAVTSNWEAVMKRYSEAFYEHKRSQLDQQEKGMEPLILFFSTSQKMTDLYYDEVKELCRFFRTNGTEGLFLGPKASEKDRIHELDMKIAEYRDIDSPFFSTLTFSTMIWLGTESHLVGHSLFSNFPGKKFRRFFSSDRGAMLANWSKFSLNINFSDRPSDTSFSSIPAIRPSRILQQTDIDRAIFERFNDTYLNLMIVFGADSVSNALRVEDILNSLQITSTKKLRVFICLDLPLDESTTRHIRKITHEYHLCRAEKSMSTYYMLCDLVIGFEVDKSSPNALISAMAHRRPISLINSPYWARRIGAPDLSAKGEWIDNETIDALLFAICSEKYMKLCEDRRVEILNLHKPGVLHSKYMEALGCQ